MGSRRNKRLEDKKAVGRLVATVFDPVVCSGEVSVYDVAEDRSIIRMVYQLVEAGGIMRWDGDLDMIPTVDRYRESRAAMVERYPPGYPVPDVELMLKVADPAVVSRSRTKNAMLLSAYLVENEKAIGEILKARETEDERQRIA